MKVIIAGSRDITDAALIERAIAASKFAISEVVSGACRGVDKIGEDWAKSKGLPLKKFPADWRMGRSAGPRRNLQMAMYADALIAIPSDNSTGTHDMIEKATNCNLQVYVHRETA